MHRFSATATMAFIALACCLVPILSGEAGDCSKSSNPEEGLLIQTGGLVGHRAKGATRDEDEMGEEEEDVPETPAPTEAPETEAPETGEDGNGGSHWDFMDEEDTGFDDLEHPSGEEHLGGIRGVVSQVVAEVTRPVHNKLGDLEEKIQNTHTQMQELHANDDTAEVIAQALEPVQTQVEALEGKVQDQEAAQSALQENIEAMTENLGDLDDLKESVQRPATSEEVAEFGEALNAKMDDHEQNVGSALGRVYQSSKNNGKVVKKIYNDVHYGAAPSPAR